MEEKYATKNYQPKSSLYGECNVRVSVIKKKGKLVTLETCINPEGITNVLYITKLDKDGY